MQTSDTRAYLSDKYVALAPTGNIVNFHKNGLYLYVVGGSTTAVSCPPYDTMPINLHFTIDNTNGSGSLTMTPTGGGTATVVTTGKVYEYCVTAAGTLKATELAAMPT